MIKEYESFPQEVVNKSLKSLKKEAFSTNPYLKVIVFLKDNCIIGLLLYSLIYDRIEIEQFEVIKEERGKKIGDKLLKFLIEKYKGKDIKNITLEVKENNFIAINLYKKYDFEPVATRNNYYASANGILMERKYNKSL